MTSNPARSLYLRASGRARRLLVDTWWTARDAVRKRPSSPWISLTDTNMRGGNLLYYWQIAYIRSTQGITAAVERNPHVDPWLAEFPLLRDLTVPSAAIRYWDFQDRATHFFYDDNFDRRQNAAFCRALVASSPHFQRRMERARALVPEGTVVVNVRRGDYYSEPQWAISYAFDIRHHVREALELLESQGRGARQVLFISDDPQWCLSELSDLVDVPVAVHEGRGSMFDDLAVLAVSPALVLANSTFSYWGSFLAAAHRSDHIAIAPEYHQRTLSPADSLAPTSLMFDPAWLRTSRSPRDPLTTGIWSGL